MDKRILEEITNILNQESTNYSVFLKMFEMPIAHAAASSTILVERTLGEGTILGGTENVPSSSVWSTIEDALRYPGDKGGGPSEAAVKSDSLSTLLQMLETQINELVAGATRIESFWLQSGHPAYPVFWDFAFLFVMNANATILIGSSSD